MDDQKQTRPTQNVITYEDEYGLKVIEAFPLDAPVVHGEGIPQSVTLEELKELYDREDFFLELLRALQARGIISYSDYQQVNLSAIASALKAALKIDAHNLIAKLSK